MHRSFRPHNPWALIGIFLAHALITWFLATAPTRSWIPVDSRGIVVSLRENTFIIGLVGATIGFSLGRYFLPTSVILGRSKARSAKEIAHGLIVPVLTSQIAGYLIGALAALASVNYNRATEGILPLIAIFLGLASLTAWGFLVGSTLRHIWGALALVAITLSFVYAPLIANSYLIPNSAFAARPLGMVWAISEPSADLTFNEWAEAARSLFYFMILTIGFLLFVMFSQTASSERSTSKFSLVSTITLAVISISSIAIVLVPEPFKKDGVPLSCQHSGNLNICQYQVYKPLIPKISAIGEAFSAVIPQETILAVPATERHPSAAPIPHPHRSGQEWERVTAQSYADYLAGVTNCLNLHENGQLASEDSLHKGFDLSKELLRRANLEGSLPDSPTSTFGEKLSKLPPTEFSQWFFDNADAIKACAITE